jgi:flavin-binding protein dodecin
MANHTYAITHVVGTSPDGIDQAVRNGIAKSAQSLRDLDWFKVTEIRGWMDHGSEVRDFQVTMELGFRYSD